MPITLDQGVWPQTRMRAITTGEATKTPAIKVARLKKLLQTDIPSICVIRGEGIGDVIMTTPTIAALKNTFPTAHITYATNLRYLDGALRKVLLFNPDIFSIIDREDIKPDEYDIVINLHCPCFQYETRDNPPMNRIDLFAHHVGLRLQDTKPKYYIQQEEIESGEDFVRPYVGDRLMLVQPFASCESRSFEHDKLKKAVIALSQQGIRSIIIQHEKGWKSDTIWSNIPGAVLLDNADVRRIASVMYHCDLVLCPDSSILHLAGCLDIPTVSLFGPTHPDARINHYPKAIALWEGKGLMPCPCWQRQPCPIGMACWRQLQTERIVDTCLSHLKNTLKVR